MNICIKSDISTKVGWFEIWIFLSIVKNTFIIGLRNNWYKQKRKHINISKQNNISSIIWNFFGYFLSLVNKYESLDCEIIDINKNENKNFSVKRAISTTVIYLNLFWYSYLSWINSFIIGLRNYWCKQKWKRIKYLHQMWYFNHHCLFEIWKLL